MGVNKWNEQNVVIVPIFKEKCVISLSDPEFDVSLLSCCALDNGNVTSNKYLESLDLVISNVSQKNYLDVCKGFCQGGSLSKNSDSKCITPIGQAKFEACSKASIPEDCIGKSKPVAYSGMTYYYVLDATNKTCTTRVNCIN
jgi:hypothetical protein